jgi:hypothetical protein
MFQNLARLSQNCLAKCLVEDGLGSGEVDNEDVERLVDELPGDGIGRSGASSSWLGYHQ